MDINQSRQIPSEKTNGLERILLAWLMKLTIRRAAQQSLRSRRSVMTAFAMLIEVLWDTTVAIPFVLAFPCDGVLLGGVQWKKYFDRG